MKRVYFADGGEILNIKRFSWKKIETDASELANSVYVFFPTTAFQGYFNDCLQEDQHFKKLVIKEEFDVLAVEILKVFE